MVRRFLFLTLLLSLAVAVSAEVKLPSVLGNDMVLQRNSEVNLWGSATPDRTVTVRTSWNGKKYKTKSDSNGKWALKVATGEAGGPYEIEFSDGDKLTLGGILLGEVWVCGGQSNMEMPIKGFVAQPVQGAAEAIRDSYAHPDIRIFNVGRNRTETPQDDCKGEWKKPTPQNVAECSATAYFFGRMLTDILGVPVGLVTSYWGGTKAEVWMTRDAIKATEGIDHAFALKPDGNGFAPQTMYNGMIHPIAKFTAKGFIWYQGESNRDRAFDYGKLFVSLIKNWREAWGDDNMSFLCAQLVQYRYDGAQYLSLPVVIEGQYYAAQTLKNVYVAPTTDLSFPSIIHPPFKREVGERLAGIALDKSYSLPGFGAESPRYESMQVDGNKVVLRFTGMADNAEYDAVGENFSWVDKDMRVISIKGFEVAGADRKFYPAKARNSWPVSDRITVESDSVKNPVAVRYAFRNSIDANVITGMGTPLAPFRTDNWEIPENELFKK